MKKILTYITLVLLLVVQTAAGRYIRFFGVLPNLALTLSIIYSLTNGSFRAAVLGLVCGLLLDSSSNVAFGFNALLLMYLCIAASYFSKKYYYENKIATLLGVFIYTVVFETISLVLTQVLFSKAPFFYTFFRFILIEAIINSIISVPLMLWVKWLNNEYIRGI